MSQNRRIYYNLLQRVGNQSNYQSLSLKIFILISLVSSSTFFVNTYLFFQAPYQCKEETQNCNSFVCSLPIAERKAYLPEESIKTLANFNGDNRCQTLHDVTAMQEAMLLGASLGLFAGVIISDAIGRRLTVLFSLLCSIVGILVIVTIDNIKIKCIGLVLWGSGAEISFTLLFSYLTQIVCESQRLDGYVKLNAAFAGGATANAIVFYIFKDWILALTLYYGVFNCLAFIVIYFYIESPPLEIISKNKDPRKAFEAFMRIAIINEVKDHGITLQEITQIHKEYHENQSQKGHAYFFTFLDIFRYSSLRSDFLKTSFVFFVLMFLLYAPVLLLDKLFTNIFLNGVINGLSQFATIPVLFKINPILNRREGLMGMFGLFALFTFFQFLINKNDCLNCNSSLQSIFILIFFFSARFFINLCSNFFSTSITETFPAQIRSICVCGVVGVGRFSTLTIPFVPYLKEHLSLSYNLLFGMIGLVGILSSYLMRQTLDILPTELIQEFEMEQYRYSNIENVRAVNS